MKNVVLRTLIVPLLLSAGARGQSAVATFTLSDHLKRHWQHELVFFPVSPQVYGRDDLVLLAPGEKPQPYQWVPGELAPAKKDSIAFHATVAEFTTSTYRLVQGKPESKTDLRLQESSDTVTMENGLTGIRLGGRDAKAQGPIAGIRLKSGRYVGGGEIRGPLKPTSCSTRVLIKGPVFADALVEYELPNFCYWRLKVRVIAGEPVVLVDEEFVLPDGSSYVLNLAKSFSPDELFYRDNANNCQLVRIASLAGETACLVRAWPTWWGEIPEGNWMALCHSRGDDLLMIGCREPGVWVEPGRTEWDTTIKIGKSDLAADFQLRGFRRKWMLAALSKAESVPEKEKRVAPLPQQLLIKHGDVPLDTVKDFAVSWNDSASRHPGLFLSQNELQRFRSRFRVDEQRLAKLRETNVFSYQMDEHVAYYLATGDAELGTKLKETAFKHVQSAVDGLVKQDQLRNQGSCPHHRVRSVMWGAILSDLALSPGLMSAEERTRLKAQLAFLGYALSSPTFHSPERGYRANPNMTTMARGMLGLVACTLPNHPDARRWAKLFTDEVEKELSEWCGPNGGWLEAPHYMTASMDSIIGPALALRGKGLSDVAWHEHPKLKASLAWLAKISTPPDSRLGGDRHMPAIGNTYLGERTCLPGWAAWMWKDKDRTFARHMQWMWKAQGSPTTPGIGGAYPGLQGYARVILDESLPASPPQWGTELFPDAGAVLRAHFPSDRETYLHYIQGSMHQHYDFDEGSFILWGKGKPLCEDFGYYGRAPAADHSRIDDGFYEALGVEGKIQEFTAGEAVDYLRGERHGWHRQILFVKDRDPLAPNYFLVRDAVLNGRDFDWRVWIATDEPFAADQNPVRAKGRFGVDLVVFFLTPSEVKASSEQITRTAGTSGWGHDNRSSTQRSLQLKQVSADQPVCVVLYPALADEPTPKFKSLAGGRAVKISTSFGTDYAALALERFHFEGDGIVFDGKAGAIQVRPDGTRLSLPRRGTLSYRGQSVDVRTEPERSVMRVVR